MGLLLILIGAGGLLVSPLVMTGLDHQLQAWTALVSGQTHHLFSSFL